MHFIWRCHSQFVKTCGVGVLADLAVDRILEIKPHECPWSIPRTIQFLECYDIEYSIRMEDGRRVIELRSQRINVVSAFKGPGMRII